MVAIFMSYSHLDEALRDQLEIHLTMLKRQGVITVWHDRRIIAGDELDGAIDAAMEEAQVILLLVSPDFLASDYCYDQEMGRAMERHEAGDTRVLPVILRPCAWHHAPFGKLRATPTDGKAVTKWPNIDEAFLCVEEDIRRAVAAMASTEQAMTAESAASHTVVESSAARPARPRSSNLRVRQTFTEADKDRFLIEAFEYMANFFEESLKELEMRNPGIQTTFQPVDARNFTAVVYRDGEAISRCRIFVGGHSRKPDSIAYSMDDSSFSNSYNESLSVVEGEQMLGLEPLGMWRHGGDEHSITFEGAAELYWSILIEPLQH